MQQSPYAPPREPAAVEAARPPSDARGIAAHTLGAASLLAAAIFVVWAIWLSSGLSIFVIIILGLIAAPYLLLWLACRALTGWIGMMLAAVALVGCIWIGVYAFDAVDDDAQGGVGLVFIPILQLGGVICAACLGGAFDWIARKVRAGS